MITPYLCFLLVGCLFLLGVLAKCLKQHAHYITDMLMSISYNVNCVNHLKAAL